MTSGEESVSIAAFTFLLSKVTFSNLSSSLEGWNGNAAAMNDAEKAALLHPVRSVSN